MNHELPLLDQVSVASPCHADWDAMQGDERVRFCKDCRRHVYNLSEMSRDEASQLVSQTEGRLCVRFYRRADGTLLTSDCPVGLALLRRQLARALAAAAALFAFLCLTPLLALARGVSGGAAFCTSSYDDDWSPLVKTGQWIDYLRGQRPVMGAFCIPSSKSANLLPDEPGDVAVPEEPSADSL